MSYHARAEGLGKYDKFISVKNIIILFVSSDDFTSLIWGWKTANIDYSLYIWKKGRKPYINLNTQAKVKGVKTTKY